jgi:hypothetical protein
MSSEQAEPGRSYTLREAAGILGVSVTALRRRVAAGQIRAERLERPQGSAWRVFLDAHAPGDAPSVTVVERPRSNAPAARGPEPGLPEFVSLVSELSQKLAESAAVAAMWQERARVLADQLALAAPKSSLEGLGSTEPADSTHEPLLARLRPLAPWVLAVLAIVVVVGLLVWPW